MKKFLLPSLLLLIAAFVMLGFKHDVKQHDGYYYWYNGKRIPLALQNDKKFVLLDQSLNTSKLLQEGKVKKLELGASLIPQKKGSTDKAFYWAVFRDRAVFAQDPDVTYEAPFFKSLNGKELGLSNLFYVKLKAEGDIGKLEGLAAESGVTVLGKNKYMPLWYTLSCSKSSKGDALKMANSFYETGLFSASQPDLMEDNLISCVNDEFFNLQWNLRNTGQYGGNPNPVSDIEMCRAWEITRGCSNVIVAVLDHGLELNHPDLPNIHPISFDAETGTSPSQVRGNHGVPVAGIIGGSANNNIGVAGIAPNSTLMSISTSFSFTPNSLMGLANGINFAWQNGASVISNSWISTVQVQAIDDAISNAATLGRNGLGTVIVFSTANDNSNSLSYPSANPNVIAVGASTMCSQRKSPSSCDGETTWGSNYGTGLDVVAPGVKIYTTDRQGNLGYNQGIGLMGNYYALFNGTSAAVPHVSGIAALILSVNPQLTQQQVRNAIERSTKKIGSYNYSLGAGENTALTWNNEVGYGFVSAHRALLSAINFSGPDELCVNQQANYVANLPTTASVVWGPLPSGLSLVASSNNSITVEATSGIGSVNLTAQVTNGGCVYPISKRIFIDYDDFPFKGRVADLNYGNIPINSLNEDIDVAPGMVNVLLYPPSNPNITHYDWNLLYGNTPYWSPNGNELNVVVSQNEPLFLEIIAYSNCTSSTMILNLWPSYQDNYSAYSVYPNPAEEEMTVSVQPSETETAIIELYNNKGKKVRSVQTLKAQNKVMIDVRDLTRGSYVLHIIQHGKTVKRHVIVGK